jgi:hypothetical protein
MRRTQTEKKARFAVYKGRRVTKMFDTTPHLGKVKMLVGRKRGLKEYYNIKYDDGDTEDVYYDVMLTLLVTPLL